MITPRTQHRSVRLNDGRILVMGGRNAAFSRLASAELFNPATNTWTATGSMSTVRVDFSATRLADGRVLVVGGESSTAALASAELYNPATGTWSPTASMSAERVNHTATLLADGRVLIAGGQGPWANPLDTTTLYNPATGTWSAGPSLLQTRARHTATRLADGRVLVAGGGAWSNTELYNPATQTWSFTGVIQQARSGAAAVLLPSGKVLLVGGAFSGALASSELYDPAAGTWSPTGNLIAARQDLVVVSLSGGDVLAFGGTDASSGTLSSVERWSEATGTWALESPLSKVRPSLTAEILSDDRVLVVSDTVAPGAEVFTSTGLCTPTTCAAQGKNCGTIPDGCGGSLTCGTCSGSMSCQSNVCSAVAPALTAVYDSVRKVPACDSNGSSCSSGALLTGRGALLGPEPHYPNTLGNSCPDDTGGSYGSSPSIEQLRVYSVDGSALTSGERARVEAVVYGYSSSTNYAYLAVYVASNADAPVWTYATSAYAYSSGLQTLVTGEFTLPVGPIQAVRGVLRVGNPLNSCNSTGFTDNDDLVFRAYTPPDTIAPTVALTSPGPGAVVRNTLSLQASASDARGVTRVDFYDGEQLLGSDATEPYAWSWDSRTTVNGVHQLTARALDAAGNVGVSPAIQVTVDNDKTAPTVQLTSPVEGAVLRGAVGVSVTATDNVGVVSVDYEVDGNLYTRVLSAPFGFQWRTYDWPNGSHVLRAIARDAAGNVSIPSQVGVMLDNDKVAPTVQLTSPSGGATLTGSVMLTADAADNVGVARVEFYSGMLLLGSVTNAPFQFTWNTVSTANGATTLTALAYDAAGNKTWSAAVPVTVDNPVAVGSALYDAVLRAPRCATAASWCDSGTLLNGRGNLGPEPNQPNTVNGSCSDGTSGSFHSDESLDRLKVSAVDGGTMLPGKTVRVEATVWAYSGYTSDKLDLYYAASANSPSWTYLTTLTPSGAGAQTLSATYVLPAGTNQAVRGVFRFGGSSGACPGGSYTDVDDLAFVTQ